MLKLQKIWFFIVPLFLNTIFIVQNYELNSLMEQLQSLPQLEQMINDNPHFKKIPFKKKKNPDIYRNSTELIRARGFDVETHTVETYDGYQLNIFRIVNPFYANRSTRMRPVVLWHGISVNSDSWLWSTDGRLNENGQYVENGKLVNRCGPKTITNTLSYTLATCGFDVWLGNSRGNQYSNKHRDYSNKDPEFWKYTLTELALYDVPGVVDYILNQDSLAYIGHSLGTDQMFALQSMRPEYGERIRPFIALAPVAFVGNIWSSFLLGVPLEPLLRAIPAPLGLPPKIMQFIGADLCNLPLISNLCMDFLWSLNGYDPKNYNKTLLPVNMAHFLVPTSTWLYAHLSQMIISKHYRMIDFGPKINQEIYGNDQPPDYPLDEIQSSDIAIYQSMNDPLADLIDVDLLVHNLNITLLDRYMVPDKNWNHHDFVYSKNQGRYINGRLIKTLKQYDNK
ncbi:Alpha/beta-hydrolase lipase region [Blomia tropicalis]|nr:Alpha/beta-hydrolase lipase region [Blomia tropicalis]